MAALRETTRAARGRFGALAAIVLTLVGAACAPADGPTDQLSAWQKQVVDTWKEQHVPAGGGASTTTTRAKAAVTGTTTTTRTTTTIKGATTTSTSPKTARGAGSSALVATTTTTAPTPPPSAGSLSVRVSGASLIDAAGKTLQLRGVNRPGLEYSCSQSDRFISDPHTAGNDGTDLGSADAAARALTSWDRTTSGTHAINTVRVSLNEACWLGINGAPAAYSGAPYRAFVQRFVDNLTGQGMRVILVLHWSAPGTWLPGRDQNGTAANGQNLAPNVDHSVDFWRQVAQTYKSYGNVVFDLFNEPGLSCNAGSGCPASIRSAGYFAEDDWAWKLYRDGGSYTYNAGDGPMYASRIGQTFQVAGTQQLLNTIRSTGSVNPVVIETLGFGNGYIDMMGTHMPTDPAGQLIASVHMYDFSGANAGTSPTQVALSAVLAAGKSVANVVTANVTGHYPFFIGEFGSTGACPQTNAGFVSNIMNWADNHGYSYTAWAWDQGEGCGGPTLVTNNDSGATSAYGQVVKAHLQSLES